MTPPSSQQIVTQAHLRFHQLKEYGFDWSSFYNGYLEGRVAGCLDNIEDGAMNLGLIETDKKGNYRLITP